VVARNSLSLSPPSHRKGKMKEIELSGTTGKGKYVLVDDDDYERLSQNKWYISHNGYCSKYARIDNKQVYILMHRELLGLEYGNKSILADHINHNRLDNRKSNLRVCTPSQNRSNTKNSNSKSGIKGVYELDNRYTNKKYRSVICLNGKIIQTYHKTKEQAIDNYNKKAKELFGEFAYLTGDGLEHKQLK
jgi:hypothetical protein